MSYLSRHLSVCRRYVHEKIKNPNFRMASNFLVFLALPGCRPACGTARRRPASARPTQLHCQRKNRKPGCESASGKETWDWGISSYLVAALLVAGVEPRGLVQVCLAGGGVQTRLASEAQVAHLEYNRRILANKIHIKYSSWKKIFFPTPKQPHFITRGISHESAMFCLSADVTFVKFGWKLSEIRIFDRKT